MTLLIGSNALAGLGLLLRLMGPVAHLQRRYNSSLSYNQISGSTSIEEFRLYGQKLDQIVQSTLLQKKAFEIMSALKIPEISRDFTVTSPNTVYWNSLAGTPIKILPNGNLELINEDKRVLIGHLWAMIQKGEIVIQRNVAVINEGADNGDFLGFVIPALLSSGALAIDVSLYNGNESKLAIARAFSSLFVGSKNVSTHVFDSFHGSPAKIELLRGCQHIHLPFRLMIVESPDRISYFLNDRVSRMRPGDILLASFLHLDRHAEDYFSKRLFSVKRFQTHAVFEKPATHTMYDILNRSGALGSDYKMVNTAYSVEGVLQAVKQAKGVVCQMHTTSAKTDEGYQVTTIGTILKR